MTQSPGLVVQGLSFQYEKRRVLHDVTLSLARGEMVALLGINGCGKTTLLRCLTGYLNGEAGTINWDGIPLEQLDVNQRARTVFLSETTHVPPFPCTVGTLIMLGRSAFADRWGNLSSEDRERALAVAASLHVDTMLARPYQELSQGERQRVRLAMALAAETPYLLLDEPTSHLDPSQQAMVLRLLSNHVRETRHGVLAVLHDMNLARLFDRILVLHEGRIAAADRPGRVIEPTTLARIFGAGVFDVIGPPEAPIGVLRDPRITEHGGTGA